MDDAKQQLAEKINTSNNILVSVSRNPSVDQLSALLGLTLALNKKNKHAAAVFSGHTPSTIEFLQPDETIEKNTDSLRDFIIALDKNKADKLRYKVEDDVVRIFITPYKTSISQTDFDFSQGDFNVDVVVALGVQQQEDLDEAITAHGRILHDATVTSVNTSQDGGLGSVNWHEPGASSLSEMITELIEIIDPELLDEQIATALLTGIVSETDRFRNEKTSSQTMTMSAALMRAGANQQLVANELEEPVANTTDEPSDDTDGPSDHDQPSDDTPPSSDDGTIEITHDDHDEPDDSNNDAASSDGPDAVSDDQSGDQSKASSVDDSADEPIFELPSPVEAETPPPPPPDEPEPDSETQPEPAPTPPQAGQFTSFSSGSQLVTEPPSLGGTLTANSSQNGLDPSTDPFGLPNSEPPQLLDHDSDTLPSTLTPPPPPPTWVSPSTDTPDDTLTQLEHSVDNPPAEPESIDAVRDEVSRALSDVSATDAATPQPIAALNAQPVFEGLNQPQSSPPPEAPLTEFLPPTFNPPAVTPTPPPPPQADPAAPASPQVTDSNAPPPVPPPIPFQFGAPPQQ